MASALRQRLQPLLSTVGSAYGRRVVATPSRGFAHVAHNDYGTLDSTEPSMYAEICEKGFAKPSAELGLLLLCRRGRVAGRMSHSILALLSVASVLGLW